MPHISEDVYCAETNRIYEFFGCYWHGCTGQIFRVINNKNGDTLAARYEQTMARLEQITRAGYQVKVQWKCLFDDAGIATPELLAHPTVCKTPLCTRNALCGGRTEAMRLHYKARRGETIQYVDVMSFYPYIWKYLKFHVGHPLIHVGETYKEKEACLLKEGLIKYSIFPPETFIIPCSTSEPIRKSCLVFVEHAS